MAIGGVRASALGYVTTLTVYADYITEGDGGKAAPLRRPTAGGLGTNIVPMRKPS